jgi:hypothetical protein
LVPWKYLDMQPFLKYRLSYWALYTDCYTRGKWVALSYCSDYFETKDLFHFHLMGRKLFPSASHVKSSLLQHVLKVFYGGMPLLSKPFMLRIQ